MHFTDKDLIAYYLRELPPHTASALEQALQADSELAARYDAYTAMLRSFKQGAPTIDVNEEAMARYWSTLQPVLAAARIRPSRPFRWRYPALAGAGLAFAATLYFVAIRPHHTAIHSDTFALREPGHAALIAPYRESASKSNASIELSSLGQPRVPPERVSARGDSTPSDAHQFIPIPSPSSLPLSSADTQTPYVSPLAAISTPVLPSPQADVAPASPTASPQSASSITAPTTHHLSDSVHHEYPTDLTFAMGGTLIGTRNVSGPNSSTYTLGATHAASAVAAFHQQLRPALGYRVAVSYTRPDFLYSLQNVKTTSGQRDIDGRIYELAATYVVQGPHRGVLSTSAEAGGGLMAILPVMPDASTSYNLRGAALVGLSAEVALTRHIGLHATYRAQFFKGPDFHDSVDTQVTTTTLFSNEPMIGITYRFQ